MATSPQRDCYRRALGLLSRRPHFRRELSEKLTARGFTDEDIRATIDKLTDQDLLDDHRHALELGSGRLLRKGYGPRRVHAELVRRGVGEETAESVVSTIFSPPGSELERARDAARRRLLTRSASRQQLARHLDRKGFSKPVILEVLGETEFD